MTSFPRDVSKAAGIELRLSECVEPTVLKGATACACPGVYFILFFFFRVVQIHGRCMLLRADSVRFCGTSQGVCVSTSKRLTCLIFDVGGAASRGKSIFNLDSRVGRREKAFDLRNIILVRISYERRW